MENHPGVDVAYAVSSRRCRGGHQRPFDANFTWIKIKIDGGHVSGENLDLFPLNRTGLDRHKA